MKTSRILSILLIVALLLTTTLPLLAVADVRGVSTEVCGLQMGNELCDPSDLRNFVQDVELFDMEGMPIDFAEGLLRAEGTYRFSMYFAPTPETRFALSQAGQLTYQLPTDLLYVQATDPMPIDGTDGYGWYAIDEYGLITVWFDDLQAERNIEGAADNEYEPDLAFWLVFEAVALDYIFPGELEFGNGFLFGWPALGSVSALSIGDPSDLSYFVTSAAMWTQDAGGNWVQVLPGTPAYIGQTYRFDIRFSEGDTADEQFAYNADGFLTYQLPAALTIQNAVDWTPIRLPNNNIIGQYRISSTGFVELYFNNVDANGNPRPSNFIDDPQAFFTLQIFAQFNGENLDFGQGGIITVIPTPPPPQVAVNKTSRYDPDQQRIYYTITITALGGSVTNIGLTDTLTVSGGQSIANPVTNDAFSAAALQVTRFDNTVTPPVAISPPEILQSPSVTWPSRNPASFQIDLLRNDDRTPLVLEANEFATLTFYIDLQRLIANNLAVLSPSTQVIYNFSVENTVGVISSVNPTPIIGNVVDIVRKDLPITKSGTLITTDDGTPQSIQWTTIIGDGRTTLLNSVPGGAGYTGGNVTDTLGDSLTTTPIIGGLAGISLTFTSFNPAAPTVPIVRTINASQTYTAAFNSTNNGFYFVVPPAGTMLTAVSPVQPYYNVYQITMVYYTDITGAMQGVGSAGRMFTNTAAFEGVPAVANVPVRPLGFTLTKSTAGLCGSMDAAAPNVGPNGERYFIDYEIRLGVPANMQGQPIYLYDIFGVWPGNTGAPNSVNGVTGQNAAFGGIGGPGAGVFAAPAGTSVPDIITPDGTWEALDHYVSGGGAINAWSMFFGTGSTNLANNYWPFNDARIVVIRYRLWISEGTYGPSATTNLLGRLQSQVTPFASYVQNVVYVINDHAGPQIWPPAGVSPNFILGVNVNDYWPITKQGAAAVGDPTLFNYTVIIQNNYTYSPSNGNPTFMRPDLSPIFTDTHDLRLALVPGSFFVHLPGAGGGWFAPVNGVGIDYTSTPGVFTVDLTQLQRVSTTTAPTPGAWPTAEDPSGTPAGWWGTSAIFDIHYQLKLIDGTATPAEQSAGMIVLNNAASMSRHGPGNCTFEASWTVDYDLNPLSKTVTPAVGGSNRIDVEIIINPDGLTEFQLNGVSLPDVTAIDRLENLNIFLNTVTFETRDTSPSLGPWRPLTGTGTEVVGFNQDTSWAINFISESQVNFVIPNQTPVRITYEALVTLPVGTTGSISNQIEIWGLTSGDGADNYTVTDVGVSAGGSATTLRVFKVDSAGNPLPPAGSVGPGAMFQLWGALLPDYEAAGIPSSGSDLETKIMTGSDGVARTFFYFGTQSDTDLDGMVEFNGFYFDAPSSSFVPGIGLNGAGNILFVLEETVAPDGGYSPPPPLNLTFFTINPAIPSNLITDAEALWGPIRTGVSDFITITNEPTGELTIEKSFVFDSSVETQEEIDALIASMAELSFLVIGTRGLIELYRNTVYFTDFTNNLDGTFTLHLEHLPYGTYRIFEKGGTIPGFTGPGVEPVGPDGLFVGIVTIPSPDPVTGAPITSVSVPVINSYERIPPQANPSLRINKVFHGLAPEEYPPGFELIVTGPDGFSRTIPLAEAVAGVTLENLAPGLYTITERNYTVAGFDVTTDPTLPYTAPLTAQSGQVTIQINNRYTPMPPGTTDPPPYPPPTPTPTPTPLPSPSPHPSPTPVPTPPTQPTPSPTPSEPPIAPPTGDDRQTADLIVLLLVGLSSMGGTVVYWFRTKISYQGKHL